MKFRLLFFILFTGCFTLVSSFAYSQQRTKINTDSIRLARQRVLDSTRAEQRRVLDSARFAREHITDSMNAVRRRVADSLAIIRKYRESKRYKDSVALTRQQKLDSIKTSRQAILDQQKATRQRTTDSLIAARKRNTDSVKLMQKHRADSLAVIRKYKESKRYKDSVALIRQARLDSTRIARKKISDELIAERKRSLDSAKAVRKSQADAAAAIRKRYTDSLSVVRKGRADSLVKAKERKEKLKKNQEKQKEDKLKLALELKIKKKHEAWNNEKMLKKDWSVPRRVLQNTYTRYNYFFNADRRMDEALANMQRMNKDDYDSLLALFPFDPDRDSSKLSADMDSIIQKASLGIQIHDPRTKWADDLYLLLGQAYYYKGNYGEASNSFRYIIAMNQKRKMDEQKKAAAKKKPVDKEVSIVEADKGKAMDFLKHKSVNNEAVLWLARTNTEAHKEGDAESILELIETDKNLPDEMKGRVALEKAYLSLGRKDYKTASENLAIVAADDHMPGWIRERAGFLNGQILFNQGDFAGAASSYQMVVDMKPKIEMDFYARKNLAYSLIEQGGNQEDATVALRKMLKDGKYLPYYEQIYYVLGRLSENSSKPEDAVVYLKKSIESPKSTRKQKGLSFASLGNVYYGLGDYKAAKTAYDSASIYGRSISTDELIVNATRRSKVLDNVVRPVQTIRDQDSLLALAAMSEKEQRSVVRQYIRSLQKAREDSIFRAENAANTAGNDGLKAGDGDPGGMGGGVGNWYFANSLEMQQGLNDFKRKWGTRQNIDNWRRGARTNYAGNTQPQGDGGDNQAGDELETDENGLPTEAGLLSVIPTSAQDKEKSNQLIRQAYMDLANAYVKDLEDMNRGTAVLDTLDRRFPTHNMQAEELYLRYLIALKQNKLDDAQALSERIRKEHSTTQWAAKLTPTEDTRGLLASNVSVANYYDETYGLMMQRQYSDVLERVKVGQQQYKDVAYGNRFRIMEAIALAGTGKYDNADSLLTEFISTHPSDSLRVWADAVINYVKKNKPVPPKPVDTSTKSAVNAAGTNLSGNQPGAIPSNIVPPPPGTGNTPAVPTAYTYKPAAEHYFIFSFSKMESKAMGLKAAMGDFNMFNYGSQGLTSAIEMLRQDQGVIIVKSFASATHAKIYMNAVRSNNLLLKEYKPEEYTLMIISADNFRKLDSDKDITPYKTFYKANYK